MGKPLEVRLPVCPTCGHVARYDQTAVGFGKLKFACAGPKDAQHKAVKMQMRLFREVVEV